MVENYTFLESNKINLHKCEIKTHPEIHLFLTHFKPGSNIGVVNL